MKKHILLDIRSLSLPDDKEWLRHLETGAAAGEWLVYLPAGAVAAALYGGDETLGLQVRSLLNFCQVIPARESSLNHDGDKDRDCGTRLDDAYLQSIPVSGADLLITPRPGLHTICPQAVAPAWPLIRQRLDASGTPSPIAFIDLARQQSEVMVLLEERVHRVLQHGQYIMGPEIVELETLLAAYVGVRHALTTASGTDSLEIALRTLDLGPGDEVITVPFTWISTAEVIAAVGARPVFVDIEPAGFNLDVAQLEAAISPRTKAIMPVSLFGQMPDYAAINRIAARHGIPVIEDGAQSFGATQNGRRSCSVTGIASTSFFPAKPLGCYGDGGALFTQDDALAAKMRAIRTHGGEKRHHHPYVGMNGRFDTLQAAVLLAKWPVWENEVAARNRLGARYMELLRGVCGVPEVMPGNTHVYAQYTIRAADRDAIAVKLKEKGVPTAVYYPKCLHEQPVFAGLGYGPGSFPESEKAAREVLSLPMHPYLTDETQLFIAQTVRESVTP